MGHISLLYSDTGGGHRTAAEAIQQAIFLVAGDAHQVDLVNGVDYLPFPFDRSVDTYASTIRRAPWMHGLGYQILNGGARRRLIGAAGMALDGRRALNFVRKSNADVYVSCQPHFNPFIPRAIRRTGARARYVHVVTDLRDAHAFHFAPGANLLIVPNEEVRAQAMRSGIAPDRIKVCGQPVQPDFRERMGDRAEARATLNLRSDLPVVLIMGGGDGMGPLAEVARAVAFSGLPLQLVVVAGRNLDVKAKLERMDAPVPLSVLGFVNHVPELMGAADILCTKAGPGTISEAFIAGLPILLFDKIPGQEVGNVDYVVKQGAGAWCPTPLAVSQTLREWLTQPSRLSDLRAASASLAHPEAAIDIARAILARMDA